MTKHKEESWWGLRWAEFIDLIKRGFPYIVLVIGLIMAILGMAKCFENSHVNDIVGSLGKVFVGSGLFTFMIKSFQYTGVFKDELTKIIFEPQYLENRKDLSVYWGKISRVLFEDKFKNISHNLLNDIRDHYLPTNSIMYYDEAEHVIEIIMKNKNTGDATLKRTFILKAIPENPKEKHKYTFGIAIPFKEKIDDLNYKTEVKVNGDVRIMVESKDRPDFVRKDGNLVKQYEVELNGQNHYRIERTEEVDYNIYFDNIIYFQANRIYNKLKVHLHYPKDSLNIDFKKCGTLLNFEKGNETTSSARFMCDGLIYPEQGYYINIRQK